MRQAKDREAAELLVYPCSLHYPEVGVPRAYDLESGAKTF